MSDHYTKEEVERILTTFEEKVNLVAACQGMDVKLKAAEGNLLERAEKARNVMDKALNGSSAGKLFSPDKRELLKDVFGSDGCYILKRFTAVIEPVKFSEMHEGDQRWKHLQERIWSIEKILGQLGMWKAPSHSSMPANEPSIASPVVARPGHSERLRAAVEEGAAGVISYADLLVSKGTNHGERGESDEQRRCYKRAKAAYEAAGATTSESYAGVLQSMEQLEQLRSAEAEKVQKPETKLENETAASKIDAAVQTRLEECERPGAGQAENGNAAAMNKNDAELATTGADPTRPPQPSAPAAAAAAAQPVPKAGAAGAQFALGVPDEEGRGVAKDGVKAFEWWSKAAAHGDADAQCSLGGCYNQGQGVTENAAKATEWWSKAAEQGHVDAQYNLGVCYNQGQGVTEDAVKAVEWWSKAAEQGDAGAQYSLGRCCNQGRGVAKDPVKAAEWWSKAAEQGDEGAQYRLAGCYDQGQGVAKDPVKAAEWWLKVAEQGYVDAQYNLAVCYDQGRGIGKDAVKAFKWWLKAAEQGDADAQYKLGSCCYQGQGVAKDPVQADEWWKKAADQGHVRAQLKLGITSPTNGPAGEKFQWTWADAHLKVADVSHWLGLAHPSRSSYPRSADEMAAESDEYEDDRPRSIDDGSSKVLHERRVPVGRYKAAHMLTFPNDWQALVRKG